MGRKPNTPERFWQRVDKASECWEWTGARTPAGYGKIGWAKQDTYAHRIAWMLTHGAIPDGLHVLHRCDNPPCCKPAHLFLGTPADNAQDRDKKGRTSRQVNRTSFHPGSAHPNVRLTEEAVRSIRIRVANGERMAGIAREYGVSRQVASDATYGRTWGHIPGSLVFRGTV